MGDGKIDIINLGIYGEETRISMSESTFVSLDNKAKLLDWLVEMEKQGKSPQEIVDRMKLQIAAWIADKL